MKYYSQDKTPDLFELQNSLNGLNPSNRWVMLGENLPWDRIEIEYNKCLQNQQSGAGNKPARRMVGALIIKHLQRLSDEETIQAIIENPYMQKMLGLPKFTDIPICSPELLCIVRSRLGLDFFNNVTLMISQIEDELRKSRQQERLKNSGEKNDDANDTGVHGDSTGDGKEAVDAVNTTHGGKIKIDATCCDAEVAYPTDSNLLEQGSREIDRLLDKICSKCHLKKPQTHRCESRKAYLNLTKRKRKGRKLINATKHIQLRCLDADLRALLTFLGRYKTSITDRFTRRDWRCLHAVFKMYEQQSKMYEDDTRRCADRIISIYQPHLRPIVRGKAKAKVEFGAKIGVSVVNGYTYVDHLSWDAYNECADLKLQIELYQQRFGKLPAELQADKLYLNRENRSYLKEKGIACYNHPLGRPPREKLDVHQEEKKRAIGERNEVEATFGTSKRVYRANDIRAKLPHTASSWIGACFFAKNIKKFLTVLLCRLLSKMPLKTIKSLFFDLLEVINGRIQIYSSRQLVFFSEP